jgi:Calcineurin-like phosphoesterase
MSDNHASLRACVVLAAFLALAPSEQDLALPNRADSVKLAAIGDNGNGSAPQYETAAQMTSWHARFPFEFVLMLGDNIIGGYTAADFAQKFERPYKPLLSAGVLFYASLGNHDQTASDTYAPFNMNGRRYYTYVKGIVRFVVLDSNDSTRRSSSG